MFKTLQEQSDHWYYSTKIYYLRKLFQRYCHGTTSSLSISDWGAGNGIIGLSLLGFLSRSREISLDLIDTGYAQEIISDESKNLRYMQKPDLNKKYNLLMAIDVVEHINDDKGFIGLLERHMEKDSLLLLAAPALDVLWSSHDLYLEHYRRYNLHSLESICASSNLRLLESGYLFTITLPIMLFVRLIRRILPARKNGSDMTIVPDPLNYLLKSVLWFESLLKLHFKPFAKVPGSTVFVVAQKNE